VIDNAPPWSEPPSPLAESDSSLFKGRIEQLDGPKSIDHVANLGQPEDELEHWDASPFASLARGLGGGLSRGLRGKEDKRKPKTPNSAFVPKKSSMNQVLS
jgi:hypothetical protein